MAIEKIELSTGIIEEGKTYKVNLGLLYDTDLNKYKEREVGVPREEEFLYRIKTIYDITGNSNGKRVCENGEVLDSLDINIIYLYEGDLTEEKIKLMEENVEKRNKLRKNRPIFPTNKLSSIVKVEDIEKEEMEKLNQEESTIIEEVEILEESIEQEEIDSIEVEIEDVDIEEDEDDLDDLDDFC